MDFLVDHAGAPDAATAHELALVLQSDLARWLEAQDASARAWVAATGFKAERHQVVLLPSPDGVPRRAALGLGTLPSLDALELWHVAGLPDRLPVGTHWRVTNELTVAAANALVLGWAYGSYRFDAYKSSPSQPWRGHGSSRRLPSITRTSCSSRVQRRSRAISSTRRPPT